jgi:hypothetical protein
MRLISTVLLMLALASPAVAARPLHLEADASRQEVLRGDIVTIDAYLFNDGTTPVQGVLGIRGPAGFELVQATPASIVTIAPGRAIHAKFGYRVLASAPHGLATFVVVAFGDDDADLPLAQVPVVVRIGPVEWPPPRRSVYLPIVRR